MRLLITIISLFMLSSCATLITGGASNKATKIFTLNPIEATSGNIPYSHYSLIMKKTKSYPGLDSSRIALKLGSNKVGYYTDAAWVERLPQLIFSSLKSSFEQSYHFSLANQKAPFILQTHLDKFYILYQESEPVACEVKVSTRLLRKKDRQQIGKNSFSYQTSLSQKKIDSIMENCDQAFQKVQYDIINWVIPYYSR